MEHEGDRDPNFNGHGCNGSQRLRKRTERDENQRTDQDHLDYCIVDIDCNTEKSPGDLMRFVVTQTLVKDHPLKLV